jgi:hypothetical protein
LYHGKRIQLNISLVDYHGRVTAKNGIPDFKSRLHKGPWKGRSIGTTSNNGAEQKMETTVS